MAATTSSQATLSASDLPIIDESISLSASVKLPACGTAISAVVHVAVLVTLGVLVVSSGGSGNPQMLLALSDPESEQPLRIESLESFVKLDAIAHSAFELVSDTSPPVGPEIQSFSTPTAAVVPRFDGSFLARISSDTAAAISNDAVSESNDSIAAQGGEAVAASASFFGSVATGRRFVYILDYSTSMNAADRYGRTRFQVAAEELLRSVEKLDPEQEFFVVLFSYETRLMFDVKALRARTIPAVSRNISGLRQWLESVELAPGTDPRKGMIAAQKLKPDAIFLLTDGEFNGRTSLNRNLIPGNPTVERLVEIHGSPSPPIHTIAFESAHAEKRLSALSALTRGSFRKFER